MIRPTIPEDTPALVELTEQTQMFRPIEVQALREVLDDYHAVNHTHQHTSITWEERGSILGFAYYAPAAMTDRTWYVYWIVVHKGQQGRGIGGQMLRYLEDDIRTRQNGRLLLIETGSMPHYDLTRQFYRKHGYDEHARLQDFYADGDSMVVFRKRLN
jgi:ribosomal protein S18 acetylase RimI-like enzyme